MSYKIVNLFPYNLKLSDIFFEMSNIGNIIILLIILFVCKEMELSHMDEFIDELLREDRACDVILPRIQVRLDLS